MKLNWYKINLTVEKAKFMLACKDLAPRFDAFTVTMSKEYFDYLRNNPDQCENFIMSDLKNGMVVVAKDKASLDAYLIKQ